MESRLGIILIGPQGSGKGTQASLLKKQYHLCYIAGGNIARELAKQQTELGREVRQLMNEGKLLPDHILNSGVRIMLKRCSPFKHVLFDGYPRTLSQARYVLDLLNESEFQTLVLELALNDTASIARIRQRYVCSKCGSIIYKYAGQHLTRLQQYRQKHGNCIHCGGRIEQRSDDTEDSVKQRLQLYHQETSPVIQFFEKRGLLNSINGCPSIEIVHANIANIIDQELHGK